MVLYSQVQTPRNCRLNMQLPFERSTEGSFFLQATPVAKLVSLEVVRLH